MAGRTGRAAVLPVPCSARTAAGQAPCRASRYDRQIAHLIPARRLIEGANHGDANEAFALYQYFSLSNYNEVEEERWLKVAAEHGNAVAQYNLAVRCLEKNDLDQATYWANKAFSKGDKDAADLLNEINKKRGR